MNGIFSKSARSASARRTNHTHKNNSVETAGSLAMMNYNPFAGMMKTQLGDVFSSNNPVIVNYEMFADCNYVPSDCIGFLGGFENAVSTLNSAGGFSDGGSYSDSGFSDGGFSSGFSSGMSAGGDCSGGFCSSFSSVC